MNKKLIKEIDKIKKVQEVIEIFDRKGYTVNNKGTTLKKVITENFDDEEMSGGKKYANIVFMQGSEADEPLDILNNDGPEALLAYLQQWDYGEYYDVSDEPSAGSGDRTIEMGEYIISYNSRIGYIGLEKIISAEDYD